ncbi:hypothetical protein CF15_04040 [Pyrodictium occultum]|uniref:Uncharacterized protein n=1 Tax=Pyrodictium occultum TaxID=2309 RepID=A0A0V8RVB4_PYROC|nr:hypothetical protein CF15_04040 [Pyrodictium occultum]
MVTTPPSIFDAAVLARTLYAALGTRGWKLTVIGMGRRLPLRLVTESRLPISVAKSNISMELASEPQEPIYIVDARGEPAWSMEPPRTLIVDYGGAFASAFRGARRVRGLGLPSLTYEAVTLVYEFFIRRRSWRPDYSRAFSRDLRSGLYLARKLLEALQVFDNYAVLEPSVVAYTLRRVYINKGIALDPEEATMNIDVVEGRVRQRIVLRAYSTRGLREAGRVEVLFDGENVEIRDHGGLAYRIVVDVYRRVACSAPGLCAGGSEEPPGEAFPQL